MLDSNSQSQVLPKKAEPREFSNAGNGNDAFPAPRDSYSATSQDNSNGDALRQQAGRLLSSAPAESVAVLGDQRMAKIKPDITGIDRDIFSNRQKAGNLFETEGRNLLANFQRVTDEGTLKEISKYKETVESRVQSGLVSRDEMTATYRQINKLLNTSSPFLNEEQRVNVAGGILYHVAHGRIDQGFHKTSHVSALQNIAFSERPSLAAEMITTAALEGQWTAKDGKIVNIPKDSLKPGYEEMIFPPGDEWRSHASQIFQVVMLNDIGMREKEPMQFVNNPPPAGGYRHTLGMRMLPFSEYWMPNGIEAWRDSNGRESGFAGLSGRQIQEASSRLFHDKFETIAFKSPYEALSHPWSYDKNAYKSTTLVETESGLRQKLIQLKDSGRLPAIVAVNGDALPDNRLKLPQEKYYDTARLVTRPIKSAHEAIDAKLGIANHAVTVTFYDRSTDRVRYKDSRGERSDGWISVRDLWKAL